MSNKIVKKNFKIFLLGMLFILSMGGIANAADEPKSSADAEGQGFWKKVQHPKNQIGDGEALDLMMEPNQKQKVNVEIENFSDKEMTVNSKLTGARTNGSGGLEYSPNDFAADKTMKYDLSDLVSIPDSVVIPPKGKANLVIDIQMPEVPYDGIVTGGIQLTEESEGQETTNEKGASIVNKIAYVFGVTLRMTDNEVKPDFELRSVKAGLANYRNAIIIDLANTQPFLAKEMTMTVDITKKGKSENLYHRKKNGMSMAPNTLMSFPVELSGDQMVAGDYTANVVLVGYGEEWTWSENFTITDEDADKFNQQDVFLVQERGLDWKKILLISGSLLALIILITGSIVLFKKKKKNKGRSKRK